MGERNHRNPQDCVDCVKESRAAERVIVGGGDHATVRKMVDQAHRDYDLPTDASDFTVRIVDSLGGAYGCVSPYGAGRYVYEFDDNTGDRYWAVEEQPDGFVLFVSKDSGLQQEEWGLYDTVRHEIAHAINWYLDGITYEQDRNHKEWLERLEVNHRYPARYR